MLVGRHAVGVLGDRVAVGVVGRPLGRGDADVAVEVVGGQRVGLGCDRDDSQRCADVEQEVGHQTRRRAEGEDRATGPDLAESGHTLSPLLV